MLFGPILLTSLHLVVNIFSFPTLFIFLLLSSLSSALTQESNYPLLNTKSSLLRGNIQIQGRELLLDGVPFVMKAVCYSPIAKGKSAHSLEDVILLHPSKEDLVLIEHDFKLMQDAGVNTVRTYFPMTEKPLLDLLEKYHLRTIVPIFNSLAFIPYDQIHQRVTQIAAALKNHPSTLLWEVGNEWNYNNFYSSEVKGGTAPSSLELLTTAITALREEDQVHPISTVLGDLPKEESFWKSLPDAQIDLYGSNIYDGLTFGDRFQRWKNISTKPLYIAEFGATAFNDKKQGEDDASQALALRSLLTQIQENLSAKNPDHVLVGGAIFEFADEWWKGGGSPSSHGSDGFYLIADQEGKSILRSYPSDHLKDKNSPKIAGPYPDQIFHEKWWGIVDIDRNKRPAYKVVEEIYHQ